MGGGGEDCWEAAIVADGGVGGEARLVAVAAGDGGDVSWVAAPPQATANTNAVMETAIAKGLLGIRMAIGDILPVSSLPHKIEPAARHGYNLNGYRAERMRKCNLLPKGET